MKLLEHDDEGSKRPFVDARGRLPVWRILSVVALVVGLLVIAVSVSRAHERHATERRLASLQGDWAALHGCLLGAPLAAGESASSRFRAVELTVLGTSRAARATEHEAAWPVRCAEDAEGVARDADGATNAVELRTVASALAKELREDRNATADLRKLVDQTWKTAGSLTSASKPANAASAPRPTTPVLSSASLSGHPSFAGDFALSSVKVDPAASANLRFLIDDRNLRGGDVVCSASGAPMTLSCEPASSDVATRSPGLSLFGTTDVNARPWLFAGSRGELGIYRPSGTVATTGVAAWGATVTPDDSAWLLVRQPGTEANELGLVHAPLTGDIPPAIPALAATEVATPADATLVWDWVIDWTGPRATLPHHLVAHHIGSNGALAEMIDIGNAPDLADPPREDTEPRFTACRSRDHLALRVHGARADVLTFFTGVAWTTPVVVSLHGGHLACEQNEAVVTAVRGEGAAAIVTQSRCLATGCKESTIQSRDLFADTDVAPEEGRSFAATELDGRLLLVWNAGPVGGLRMRLGTADALKARDDVVIADEEDGQKNGMVTDLRLVSASEDALLFAKTLSGVHLFSVDHDAKVTPLGTQP